MLAPIPSRCSWVSSSRVAPSRVGAKVIVSRFECRVDAAVAPHEVSGQHYPFVWREFFDRRLRPADVVTVGVLVPHSQAAAGALVGLGLG